MIGLFLGILILGIYLFIQARAKHCPKGCHGCGKCMKDNEQKEKDPE